MVLTPTHEFNRAVGIPRSAAIGYPYGRSVGQVNDVEGQRAVLLATLSAFEQMKKPGDVRHLPFIWPEDPKTTKWHPPEISPLVKVSLQEIKKARNREK